MTEAVDHDRILLQKLRDGDITAREKLVCRHLPLVRSIANRYGASGRSPEDLYQVGCIGLLKAIDRFDLGYEVCFSTYAVPLILGEIRRLLREDQPLHISRQLRERAIRLDQCRRLLYQAEGKEPELSQVAEACALSPEQAVAAMEAVRPVLSIHTPRISPEGDAGELGDVIPGREGEIDEREIDRLTLYRALEHLPERLAYILRCRYFAEKTQAEVARELHISQVQVCRLEKKALSVIRLLLSDVS